MLLLSYALIRERGRVTEDASREPHCMLGTPFIYVTETRPLPGKWVGNPLDIIADVAILAHAKAVT